MILTLTIYARNYQNTSVSLSIHVPIYKENKEKLVITEANGVMKPTLMYGSTVWDSSCAESLQRVSQASEQGGKNSKRRRQKNAIDHALFHKAVVN